MAKQYIGARYVPRFYENSQDPSSAEWESNKVYEPLVIVMDGQDAYTSRKLVPATVGKPSENPTYWVKTGDYNAAMAAIQEIVNQYTAKVDALETEVEHLNDKYYIFMFDSYGGCRDNGVEYQYLLPAAVGLSTSEYTSLTVSGTGFTDVNDHSKFLEILTANAYRFAEFADKITDIVVLGGANDYTNTTAILTEIASFCSYVKTTYPNAKVSIGHISGSRLNRTELDKRQGGNASLNAYQNCGKYGARYLWGVENLVHDTARLQSDKLHPNELGVANLVNGVANAIVYGSAHIHSVVNTSPVFNTEQTIFSAMSITGSIYEQIDDDVCRLYMRQGNDITLTISGSFVDSVPVTKIATIDRQIMIGDGVLAYTIPCMCILKHGNILLANLSGELGLDSDGDLILAIANGFTYRGNTADFSEADTLIIKTYGSLTVPSSAC